MMKLFHYTDVCAVKSILEKKELWLTDVRFLNDSQEMHEGVSRIIEYIDYQRCAFPEKHEFLVRAAEYISTDLGVSVDYGAERRPVYVCSFSEQGDLLSQWRAYGEYAIEFDSDEISLPVNPCVYDVDEKNLQAANVALDSLQIIAAEMRLDDGFVGPDAFGAVANLVSLASTFKDESFSEEKEVRLVVGHDIEPAIDDGLDLSFRSRGNMLIPYVTVPIPLISIRAIHIGPMRDQELAYLSMKAFVDSIQVNLPQSDIEFGHEIQVFKSSIPYRAL